MGGLSLKFQGLACGAGMGALGRVPKEWTQRSGSFDCRRPVLRRRRRNFRHRRPSPSPPAPVGRQGEEVYAATRFQLSFKKDAVVSVWYRPSKPDTACDDVDVVDPSQQFKVALPAVD